MYARVPSQGETTISEPAPRETELKLEVAPGQLAALRSHALFAGAAPSKRLSSTYFDTLDNALHHAGVSLRVRQVDGGRVQTIKAETQGARAGLFERFEWEAPVEGDTPDLSLPGGDLVRKLAGDGSAPDLEPRFTVVVERAARVMEEGGSRLEVTLDEGHVEAPGLRAPLIEVELELQDGREEDLLKVARRLLADVPLRLAVRAKSEAGYELIGDGGAFAKAAPVQLDRAMTSAGAFVAIGSNCLLHLLRNERLVRDRRAPEAVHQARVALRRLRAAMSMFKDQFGDLESARLKDEMKRVASAMGEARDLDVFEPQLHAEGVEPEEMEALTAAFLRRREAAYDRAVAALSDPAFVRLTFDLLDWLHAGAWRETPAAQRPVIELAAAELKRRRKKLRTRGPKLHKLDPEARHRLRIQAKKLRYGAEFFAPLAQGAKGRRRAEALVEALKPVQDALGEMNDVAAQGRLVRRICDGAAPGAAFAAGAISARRAREGRNLLRDAERAARDFAVEKLFL